MKTIIISIFDTFTLPKSWAKHFHMWTNRKYKARRQKQKLNNLLITRRAEMNKSVVLIKNKSIFRFKQINVCTWYTNFKFKERLQRNLVHECSDTSALVVPMLVVVCVHILFVWQYSTNHNRVATPKLLWFGYLAGFEQSEWYNNICQQFSNINQLK